MRRPFISLAFAFVTAAVSAEAINLEPQGTSANVSESCGLPDPLQVVTGRTTRSVTITSSEGLQQMLQRAISGPAPVLTLNMVNNTEVHLNSDGVATTRTAWVNSCTPTPGAWCFNTSPPQAGDYVSITVTLTNGASTTAYYGDFSAGTVTVATSVVAISYLRTTYTQAFTRALTYSELTNGLTDAAGNPIPRCDVASITITASAAHTISALCSQGPTSASARAKVTMDPAGLNTVNWSSTAATCP